MASDRLAFHEDVVAGWRALHLTNGLLDVTVLPDKGADIYALVDRASGVDALFKAPWGLAPPGSPARKGSAGAAFLENYEGTWQELFPNTGDACTYRGAQLPLHGEVAELPWAWSAVPDDPGAVRLSVDCRRLPLRLERLMRLERDQARLVLEETVTNLSGERVQFVWGHHCVLGAPLVADGAELRVPCRTVVTAPYLWEETARLVPGQRGRWPIARLRTGADVDLSRIAGPETQSHDDVYLTDLDDGWAEVRNAALRLRFRLEWDRRVFGWVVAWQPYGGARAMPLRGSYGLGVEPWVSGGNLAAAAAAGSSLELDSGQRLSTTIAAELTGW